MTRLAIALVTFAAVVGVAGLGERTTSAGAACIVQVQAFGQTYTDGGLDLERDDVGRHAVVGAVPPCLDTVPSRPGQTATPVRLRRVVGVAPRYALTEAGGAAATVRALLAEAAPCRRHLDPTARLACLRTATRKLNEGPSLVAPVTAAAGTRIPVVLRGEGAERVGRRVRLARLDGPGRWSSVTRLTLEGRPGARRRSLVLPPVPAGTYRIGALTGAGSLVSVIGVSIPPQPVRRGG